MRRSGGQPPQKIHFFKIWNSSIVFFIPKWISIICWLKNCFQNQNPSHRTQDISIWSFFLFLYFGFSPIKCLFGGKIHSFWSLFIMGLPAWLWGKKGNNCVWEVMPPHKVSPPDSDPQAGKSIKSPKYPFFNWWTKHSHLYTQIDLYDALIAELLLIYKSIPKDQK